MSANKQKEIASRSYHQISFTDYPNRVSAWEGLPQHKGHYNYSLESTAEAVGVISLVGDPKTISPAWYSRSISVFEMRPDRSDKGLPWHLRGKLRLGDIGSYPNLRNISLPAVGTDATVAASMSNYQNDIANWYTAYSANAYYILGLQVPMGATVLLNVWVKSADGLRTKYIQWRPSLNPYLCVAVPWEHDKNVVPIAWAPKSSNTLHISTEVNNCAESVVQPLKMSVWSWNGALRLVGWKQPITTVADETANEVVTEVSFADICKNIMQPKIVVNQQSDAPESQPGTSEEVPAAEVPEVTVPAPADETPGDSSNVAKPETPKLPDKTPDTVKKPVKGVKDPIANLRKIWSPLPSFTLSEDSSKQTVTITGKSLDKKGDSIAKALRRHVWYTGTPSAEGWPVIGQLRLNITKPIQLSGLVKVSYIDGHGPSHIYNLGGNTIEVPLYPWSLVNAGNATDATKNVLANRPVMLTSNFESRVTIELIQLNRNDNVTSLKVACMYCPQGLVLQTPTKPKSKPAALQAKRLTGKETVADYIDNLAALLSSIPEVTPQSAAPGNIDGGEEGNINLSSFHTEDLEQNKFLVEIEPVKLVLGEISTIPLVLPQMKDRFAPDDVNTINELWSRWHLKAPTRRGILGPKIGHYRLTSNLPADSRARIAHVCTPSDMDSEALRANIFGNILGLAGSALSSIGGPLLNTAVDTLAPIVDSFIPGLGTIGGNIIKDIVPGILTPSKPQENNSSIKGEITLDRLVEFIQGDGDGWPKLLIQLLDVVGGALRANTVEVYPQIILDCVAVDRYIFDMTEESTFVSRPTRIKYTVSITELILIIRETRHIDRLRNSDVIAAVTIVAANHILLNVRVSPTDPISFYWDEIQVKIDPRVLARANQLLDSHIRKIKGEGQ